METKVTWYIHSMNAGNHPEWVFNARLLGPFKSDDDAEQWASEHLANHVWYLEDCISPEDYLSGKALNGD